MKRIVLIALVALAALAGAAQARAGVNAQIDVWSEAGEIGAGPGPSTIQKQLSDDGAGGVAAATFGWPLATPFPAASSVACPAGGCADRSGGATASVDEANGVLKAGAGASLLVGNPPDASYGGDANVSGEAAVSDSITLSKAATVWIEGTVHGAVAADNSDENQLADPNAEVDVKVDFCCTFRYESLQPIGGYDQQFFPDANAGTTPIDDTFSIPVDLPEGTTSFEADLAAKTDLLIDGVPGLVLAQDALLDFDGTVTFHVRVPDDVVATSDSGLLPIVGGASEADTVAPASSATVTPEPGWGDWTGGPVTVHLAATDTGGSGVASITYSADGAQSIAQTTAAGDAVDVPVSAEGVTTVTYFATDGAGNVEAPHTVTVQIDTTGPDVTATVSPAPNAAGWSNVPVTVTLHAADAASGVRSITFHDTGALTTSDVTAPGDTVTMKFEHPDDGVTTVTYRATDNLGNVGPTRTVTVRVDEIPPVVTFPGGDYLYVDATGPEGATVTYAVGVTDNVDSSPLVRCDRPSGSVFPIGPDEATCTATDLAGNVTTAVLRVAVRSAADQIGIYLETVGWNGLYVKALGAEHAARAGKIRVACNELGAYGHELDALTGKAIDPQEAARLWRDIVRIRRVLGCG